MQWIRYRIVEGRFHTCGAAHAAARWRAEDGWPLSNCDLIEMEAWALLSRSMGLDIDAESVQILAARTEGWVAGLQMAAQAN
jgi:hypothetical protein